MRHHNLSDDARYYLFVLSLFAVGTIAAAGVEFFSVRSEAKADIQSESYFALRTSELPNYDIRTDEKSVAVVSDFRMRAGKSIESAEFVRQRFRRAEAVLRSNTSRLTVEYNRDLRVPEIIAPDVRATGDLLTEPATAERGEVLRRFIESNNELIGLTASQINELRTTADYTNPDGNLSFVRLEQFINDVPVFRGEIKAGFTKRGELIRVINNLAPSLEDASLSKNFGSAAAGVKAAATYIDYESNETDLRLNAPESAAEKTIFGANGNIIADKIYFPLDVGVARPAWRVIFRGVPRSYYLIVDAETGTLFWRKNLAEHQSQPATYNVYASSSNLLKTADSPAPLQPAPVSPFLGTQGTLINRTGITLIGNEAPYNFNNLGWIADGVSATDGNNVIAGIDRAVPYGIDAPITAGNRNFNFAYNPAPGNPAPGEEPLPAGQTRACLSEPPVPNDYQKGAITHLFYTVNRYHDETYLLGFTEQAGNFQQNNFGRGGRQNDRILAAGQSCINENNGVFGTEPDGQPGQMYLYLYTSPTPMRDSGLDTSVVVHELTHGLSNRLHGDAAGLTDNMSRGMGEGWSDFFALSMLSEPTYPLDGIYNYAGYLSLNMIFRPFPIGNTTYTVGTANYYYGTRRFPKALKSVVGPNGKPHNPLSFRHLNSNCDAEIGTWTTPGTISAFPRGPVAGVGCDQTHNAGEIWSSALWEARAKLIQRLGWEVGNRRMLQYVVDGMKISPLNPTFLQARDAILAAARAGGQTADFNDIFQGFAIRGMGFSARVINQSPQALVSEAFDTATTSPPKFDFDGDKKADVSVFRPENGAWYVQQSQAGFTGTAFGQAGDRLVPADYDGDGVTDVAVVRNGVWYLQRSQAGFTGIQFGDGNDIPAPADYNGDGKSEIAVFRPSNGVWYILNLTTNQFAATQFGQSGDRPVAADYDGDGVTDIAVNRAGNWYIQRSQLGFTGAAFGDGNDKTVPADYDGDGRADIAVFRPSNGGWYLLQSSAGFTGISFGLGTDLPVPADYDGDGKTDVAVVRNGNWYLNRTTNGFAGVQFGTSTDLPIPNAFVR